VAIRSPAAKQSPASGSPPSARTRAKRRVRSSPSNGSISASAAGTTLVEPSKPINTITSAESASGTSRASPSRIMPTVPRASPDAMPGSQRSFCSSEPAN
jgi:hypothetical protein